MRLWILMLCMFLTGCFSVTANSIKEKNHEQLFVGRYVLGNDLSKFRACNTNDVFSLGIDEAEMEIIQQMYFQAVSQDQDVYVEFIGAHETSNIDLAKNSHRALNMLKLVNYSTEMPENCG